MINLQMWTCMFLRLFTVWFSFWPLWLRLWQATVCQTWKSYLLSRLLYFRWQYVPLCTQLSISNSSECAFLMHLRRIPCWKRLLGTSSKIGRNQFHFFQACRDNSRVFFQSGQTSFWHDHGIKLSSLRIGYIRAFYLLLFFLLVSKQNRYKRFDKIFFMKTIMKHITPCASLIVTGALFK